LNITFRTFSCGLNVPSHRIYPRWSSNCRRRDGDQFGPREAVRSPWPSFLMPRAHRGFWRLCAAGRLRLAHRDTRCRYVQDAIEFRITKPDGFWKNSRGRRGLLAARKSPSSRGRTRPGSPPRLLEIGWNRTARHATRAAASALKATSPSAVVDL
jgi:hypothetical protein